MGKGSKREKVIQPPPPPEPPKVAYFLFRDEVYDETKAKHKNLNRGDLAEFINNQWDKLDKAKRQEYEEKLRTQKQRFHKDIQQYEKEYGQLPEPTEANQCIKDHKAVSGSEKKHRASSLAEHGDQDGEKQSKKISKKKKVVEKGEGRIKEKKGKKKGREAEQPNKSKSKRKSEDNTRQMWVVDKNARSDEDE